MNLIEMLLAVSAVFEKEGYKRKAADYVDGGVLFVLEKDDINILVSIKKPRTIKIRKSGVIEEKEKKVFNRRFSVN